jgi:hypothetical protein
MLTENLESQKKGSVKDSLKEELMALITQGDENAEVPTEVLDKIDDMLCQVQDKENAFFKIVEASQFLLSRTKDLTKGIEKRDTKFDRLKTKFSQKQEDTMNVLREKDYQV